MTRTHNIQTALTMPDLQHWLVLTISHSDLVLCSPNINTRPAVHILQGNNIIQLQLWLRFNTQPIEVLFNVVSTEVDTI